MNLSLLRTLLTQEFSYETCSRILAETARLRREDIGGRWYFLLLNKIFVHIIDHPDLRDFGGPTVMNISHRALVGVDAIERGDHAALSVAADRVADAYSDLS